jgi:AraC-like DNA-binding protein
MPHPSPRQRRQWIAWYFAHGQDVTATCRHFGMSRPTFYRWLARYTAAPTKPLHSRRLHTRRQPTWSRDELWVLCEFLGRYPTLGRGRLTKALNRLAQAHWSPATVGRMLRQMHSRCPFCRGRNGHHISRDPLLRKDLYDLVGEALPLPLRPPPDPEVDFVLREAEAVARNPQD